MFPISLKTVTSKRKRWGKSFTKAALLMLSDLLGGPVCVLVCVCVCVFTRNSETAVPSNGTTRSMHTTPRSQQSSLSPSSELLQDKEALIKQRAREQNVHRRDCGDSDPHYLSGAEPRTAKLSPTAQNTRPKMISETRSWRVESESRATGWGAALLSCCTATGRNAAPCCCALSLY